MATKTINIATAHNIIVNFELASLAQRILAWVIDLCIVIICVVAISLSIDNRTALYFLLVFPIVSMFHLIWEIYNNGQSPGKMLLKIRVVTLNGSSPSISDYFIRWVFRTIDIAMSFGILGIFFIYSSKKSQRIGDMLAKTSVVRQRNENTVSLDSIKNLNEKIEIKYPLVAQFSDEDMLLLKQSLLRYKRYNNTANKNLLLELSSRIQDKLKIKIPGQKTLKFLDRVLYEYIVLTR